MALFSENVQFINASAYLPHINWDEITDYPGLYDFAVNSSGMLVCNRLGEMLIRVNYPETGKYRYIVVTIHNQDISLFSSTTLSVVMFGDDLQWFIENYFSDSYHSYINDIDDEQDDEDKYPDDSVCDIDYDGDVDGDIDDNDDDVSDGYDDYGDLYIQSHSNEEPAPDGYESWGEWFDTECMEDVEPVIEEYTPDYYDDNQNMDFVVPANNENAVVLTNQPFDNWDDYLEWNELCDKKDIEPVVDYCEKHYIYSNEKTLIPGVTELNSNYSRRYFLVLDSTTKKPIQTIGGSYISRVSKDNGTYRYYLTSVQPELDSDEYDRLTTFYKISSSFVGTKLSSALVYL